jgi:formylglycine-generating enzyme required for sulfatase activity
LDDYEAEVRNCEKRGDFEGAIASQQKIVKVDNSLQARAKLNELQSKKDEQDRVKELRQKREGLKFVFVPVPPPLFPAPPRDFQMGCSIQEYWCPGDEPRHTVRINKSFELGQYLVTQGMWKLVMGNNPSHYRGDKLPVENVSWTDVQDFLAKLNSENDGYHYRLPTEAEWEFAARAGSHYQDYGEKVTDVAWSYENSGNQTHQVGQKPANVWGLYDILGNVWEWVQDWYDGKYYKKSPPADPTGPATGEFRVLRGGSWTLKAKETRFSTRNKTAPDARANDVGFRCVREPQK